MEKDEPVIFLVFAVLSDNLLLLMKSHTNWWNGIIVVMLAEWDGEPTRFFDINTISDLNGEFDHKHCCYSLAIVFNVSLWLW